MQWHFEVLRPPDGEAPLEIREQWVGVWFPIEPRNMDGPQPETAEGVLSGAPSVMPDGVRVSMTNALAALRSSGRMEAAEWWTAWWNGQGQLPDELLFERSCGRIVSNPERTPPDESERQ